MYVCKHEEKIVEVAEKTMSADQAKQKAKSVSDNGKNRSKTEQNQVLLHVYMRVRGR